MSDFEKNVRDAATKLHESIVSARLEGYKVEWPPLVDGLLSIAVSETARVGLAAKPAPGDEYDAMTKTSLVELATARGIDLPSGHTKADVIALLKSPPTAATASTF